LVAAGEDPLIRAAIVGAGEMLPFVTTHGRTLVEGAAERLCVAIRARWPQAAAHDAALLAECLVRLAISYTTLPIDQAGMTASSITELFGPFIDRALLAETGTDWGDTRSARIPKSASAAGECLPASVKGECPPASVEVSPAAARA